MRLENAFEPTRNGRSGDLLDLDSLEDLSQQLLLYVVNIDLYCMYQLARYQLLIVYQA